jgi:hypothetical protein
MSDPVPVRSGIWRGDRDAITPPAIEEPTRRLAYDPYGPYAGCGSRAMVPDECSLAALVRLVANAREGARNNLTYWAACRAGEMVASGLLGANTAAAVVAQAAIRAGLSPTEAQQTARSGVRAGQGVPNV